MISDVIGNVKGKKKGILVGALIALCLLLAAALICLVLWVVDLFIPERGEQLVNSFELYEPDFEYDISNDAAYMAEDRRVWVNDGTLSAPIDDEDYSDNQLYLFFEKYFTALQTGDGETLRSCYNADVAKKLRIPYKLSMQRVYDINLQYISSESKSDSDGIVYEEVIYRFEYKIMKNDGVFRSDLESGAVRPQYITMRVYFDRIEIYAVVSNFIK
ncbi:MAG: hypothetical protein IJN63_07025 [Clostridia bacterium]|nr:hypothetical protein [Clostridia bacterium]